MLLHIPVFFYILFENLYSYTSADGSRRKESGRLVTEPNGQRVLAVRGSYDYTTPDGQRFHVDYQADTNGYRIINNKPVGNIKVHSWAKPTTGGRPVNIGERPTSSVKPPKQNIPFSEKLGGGGKPLVKPVFDFPGGSKPRPSQIRPSDTLAYVSMSRPIVHKNRPSSIVPLSIAPLRPVGSRPSKIKHSKNKRPNSHIYSLASKFPTLNPEKFTI